MRKTTALAWLGALVAGLAVLGGPAGVSRARAADAERPWLGVYMQQVTPELREGLDLGGAGGVLVSRVVLDGPADRAGIRKGDVIVRIGSRAVESPDELTEVVGSARAGQSLAVQVLRNGQRRNFDVKLGARPSDEEMQSPDLGATPQGREWGGGDEHEGLGAPEAPEPPEAPHGAPQAPQARDDEGRARDFVRSFDFPDPNMVRMFAMDRGRLGVRIQSLNPELGDYFGLRDGRGALVLEVVKDTPAARAGLLSGDVITRVDDRAVANAEDLVGALRGKEGKVSLRVVRHGAPRTIEATLERAGSLSRGPLGMMEDRPGTRREIRVRLQDRDDMRRQVEELRRQLDELQRRLDRVQGSEPGD